MRTKKGFTLIELLVVIAIIGILSSVVLASLNTARLKARNAQRISDLRQIQLALQFSFDKNGTYPIVAIAAVPPGSLVTDGFLPIIPTPPAGGVAYQYRATTATNYCLGVGLEAGFTLPGNHVAGCLPSGAAGDALAAAGLNYAVAP